MVNEVLHRHVNPILDDAVAAALGQTLPSHWNDYHDIAGLLAANLTWTGDNTFNDLFLTSGGVINWASGNVTLTHSVGALTLAGGNFFLGNIFPSGEIIFTGGNTINTSGISSPLAINAGGGNGTIFAMVPSGGTNANLVAVVAATTTNAPSVGATGSDTNIDLIIQAKGTGTLSIGSTARPGTSDGAALGTATKMWSDLFLASGGVISWDNGDVTINHAANTLTFVGATVYQYDSAVGVTMNVASFNQQAGFTNSNATGIPFFYLGDNSSNGMTIGHINNSGSPSRGVISYIGLDPSAGGGLNIFPSGGISVNTTGDPGAGLIYTNSASFLMRTKTSLTGGGTGNVPTLTAGPVTGNPTKWLPYDDNGTTRYIPAW